MSMSHEYEESYYNGEYFGKLDEDQPNWVKVTISIIIFMIGMLGNMVVIFVIVALKEYKKSTHWYVLQLAIADSLFLLSLPFAVSQDVHQRWIYKEWMCKAKETILFLNCYASIMFLSIMSLERYVAVCHTFSGVLQKLRGPLTVGIITGTTWTLCFCVCIPPMMYSATVGIYPDCHCGYVFPDDDAEQNATEKCRKLTGLTDECIMINLQVTEGSQHCLSLPDNYDNSYSGNGEHDPAPYISTVPTQTANTSSIDVGELITGNIAGAGVVPLLCSYENESWRWKALVIFNVLVMFILPVSLMIVCYGLIVRHLVVNDRVLKKSGVIQMSGRNAGGSSSLSGRGRRRETVMCATLVSCFVIMWLPFHVSHITKLVGALHKVHICENLAIAGSLMAYFNSALNPYLYTFLGSNFNQRWRNATRPFGRANRMSSRTYGRYNQQARRPRRSTSTSITTVSANQRQREKPNSLTNTTNFQSNMVNNLPTEKKSTTPMG